MIAKKRFFAKWYNNAMHIKVKVKTGQKREMIDKKEENMFIVSLKEKAERNMANDRLLEIFRDMFETKDIRIVIGAHGSNKILEVGD